MKFLNTKRLEEMISSGHIARKKHPQEELYIYNYTAKTQYDRFWNEITLQCRGLILDKHNNIIARPFPKFFNLGEMEGQVIPNEPYEVYEKMDGSLGILYWVNNKPYISTKGSFTSEQSIVANEMLHSLYSASIQKLNPTCTYLFEIIYPKNRIVVNYGNDKKLTLLAIINNDTGENKPLLDIGFLIVKRYDYNTTVHDLQCTTRANAEGYVIQFESGLRYKIKFDEYVRIHRLISGISSISIWEMLTMNTSIDEYIKSIPDEYYSWLKEVESEMNTKYLEIHEKAQLEYKELATRKETAIYFLTCTYPFLLFAMYSRKPIEKLIWKLLKPKFSKPFEELIYLHVPSTTNKQ